MTFLSFIKIKKIADPQNKENRARCIQPCKSILRFSFYFISTAHLSWRSFTENNENILKSYFHFSIENKNGSGNQKKLYVIFNVSYMKRHHYKKMKNWVIFLRCSTVVWIGPAFSINLKIFYIIWPPELTQLPIVMIFLLCFAWVLTYRSFYHQPWHCMWVHLSV